MVAKGTLKKIGVGVLVAATGAIAFGAIHHYFLSDMTGSFFGVGYDVVLPVLLGAVGLTAAYAVGKLSRPGWMHDLVVAGSAASIGLGLMSYMKWVTVIPAGTTARASAAVSRYVPPRAFAPPAAASMGMNGATKVI